MENNKKMTKIERIVWIIGAVLLGISTIIIEKWDAMAFLKLPSYILDIAGLVVLVIRNLHVKGIINVDLRKSEKTPEK